MPPLLHTTATVLLLASAMLLGACSDSTAPAVPAQHPKNMVLLIGDGMGLAYTTGYRYYADDPATPEVEPTIFDQLLVGMASTYPDEDATVVTDSAAAATALASGYKSYNGAIGVNRQGQALVSLLAKAKQAGLATGISVTAQINHATPAAFLAHNSSRENYNAIADQYLAQPVADLLFGGGNSFFRRKDRDLIEGFINRGYQLAADQAGLERLSSLPALGLFAPVGLPAAIDDRQGPRLPAMTTKALQLLAAQPQGFVLMVECSQVDWAGHDNDIAMAMHEMAECAETLRLLRDFAAQRGDTLLVATADHSTGGLSLGADGAYDWNPEVLKGVKGSSRKMASTLIQASNWQQEVPTWLGFTPDAKEQAALVSAHAAGEKALAKALRQLIDQRSRSGWTSGGHTGEDVPVFAFGPASEQFRGQLDNTDIAKRMAALLPAAR